MDDNNNFAEQENIRIMNEMTSRFNDPVNRDMLYGDRKADRSRKSTRNGVLTLLVFILFTIALILIFYNSH